jgi:hypothetical protein
MSLLLLVGGANEQKNRAPPFPPARVPMPRRAGKFSQMLAYADAAGTLASADHGPTERR